PVLGVGFSRKDVHEAEALLAARGEVVVGDPLDPSPLVKDGLNVLGFGDDAIQHWLPPCRRKVKLAAVWRSPFVRAAAAAKVSGLVETVAQSISAYNFIRLFRRRLGNMTALPSWPRVNQAFYDLVGTVNPKPTLLLTREASEPYSRGAMEQCLERHPAS